MLKRIVAAALALSVAACDGAPAAPASAGSFSVLLTDAPGDFARAVVTIESVLLQGGSGGDGPVVLRDDPVTVDLLTLRNDVMELVRDVPVPAGTYAQLRVVISGGFVEVIDEVDAQGASVRTRVYASSPAYAAQHGVTADGALQMPSFEQSGLKIGFPRGAVRVDGDQHIWLLDFNVAESFGRQAGQSGQWVMHPVIRATEFALTGGVQVALDVAEGVELPVIDGVALSPADFAVALDRNGDVVVEPFETRDDEFRATLRFLEPGHAYPIALVAPDGVAFEVEPAFPATVEAEPGASRRLEFTLVRLAVD